MRCRRTLSWKGGAKVAFTFGGVTDRARLSARRSACTTVRRFVFTCVIAIKTAAWLLGLPTLVIADAEFVTVVKVLSNDDHGIIVRANGNAYQIEKGIGCPSFSRYEGKQGLVSSPGLFLGIGSESILPNDNQKCRIWNSKEFGRWGDRANTDERAAPFKDTPRALASTS